jgi:hypothetical protein
MKKLYTILMVFFVAFLFSNISYSQSIKMNEIFARGVAGNLDWIEIYNSSSAAINIGGYKIYDSGGFNGTKPKKLFPTGTIVPGYGYTVIITDTNSFVGDSSAFGLSNGGEWVWLEDSLGVVIDSILYGATATVNESYGRAPDGGPWKLLSTITRGKSNVILTQVLLPQYMQGLNGTNNNRTPYVFRVKIDNLLSNTTYRFINQIITSADGSTTSGAGNVFFVNANIDSPFVRTTGPSFTDPGPYGTLTTDSTGSYTGWFISEPTGNARFTPGNNVFMRIRFNDGATGTTAVHWATTSDSVKVINYGTTSDATLGTGIYGRSFASPKDFIFLYDNVDGTGRPLASSVVELDGIDLSVITSFPLFYRDSVDQFVGAWGSIVPNILANGVRRVERRLFADGSIFALVGTDDDGVWPSGANTVNPLGGLTAIRIESSDAPVPVELTSFSARVIDNEIELNWITETETNNMGFEIQRKELNEFTTIGYVEGKINSTTRQNYSYIDAGVVSGKYIYRLKQIDLDGTANYSNTIEVDLSTPLDFSISQNYPNPFNPSTSINYSLPSESNVKITVYNLIGEVVKELVNSTQLSGYHSATFNASDLSSGIYFYAISASSIDGQNEFNSVRKMTLLK